MLKYKALIAFPLICLLASSCKNPDVLGLDPTDKEKINGDLKELPLKAYTVVEDSLITSKLTANVIGYINDPVMGKTKAEVAAQLVLPQNDLSFGNGPVLDSAVLILSYSGSYGPNTEPITLQVHELTGALSNDSLYYSTYNFSYSSTVLGSKTFIPKPNDSVSVIDVRNKKADTLVKLAPQVRIRLDSTFITTTFLQAAASNFASTDKFIEYFKGLYINVDTSQLPSTGGMMYFNMLNTGKSKLSLYYKNTTGDTLVTNFNINNTGVVANKYIHNYSGTEVAAQLSNAALGDSVTYVQSLSGLRTRLEIPALNTLNENGKIAINKAMLEISVPSGTNSTFAEPDKLFIIIKDQNGFFQLIPDINIGDFHYKGTYDAASGKYTFNITKYLQGLLNGTYIDNGIYLIASGASGSANRVIMGGPKNTVYPMKLSVYYTPLY